MKLFGRFLVQRNLVTPEQVLRALDSQRDSRLTIGQIAVKSGKLSPRQVLDVLNRQVLGDERPFGQIGISLGYLKPEDVVMLLEEQGRTLQALGEVLVEMGAMSRSAMEKALRDYLSGREV